MAESENELPVIRPGEYRISKEYADDAVIAPIVAEWMKGAVNFTGTREISNEYLNDFIVTPMEIIKAAMKVKANANALRLDEPPTRV